MARRFSGQTSTFGGAFFEFKSLFGNCTAPENIHTPQQKGLEFPWGVEGSLRPKHLKKCIKLNWNFQRSGDGSWKRSHQWRMYGNSHKGIKKLENICNFVLKALVPC